MDKAAIPRYNLALWRLFLLFSIPALSFAQNTYYAGALGGVAAISADARSSLVSANAAVSLYKPENGPVVAAFAGRYLGDYFAVQGGYFWNRNDVLLTSVLDDSAYEQARESSQNGVTADLLVYFRNRKSWIRPYLSIGAGAMSVSSTRLRDDFIRGNPRLPPAKFSATNAVVSFTVGADIRLGRGFAFRYSFAESIQNNVISKQLTPPGERSLATFQNLFGFVKNF